MCCTDKTVGNIKCHIIIVKIQLEWRNEWVLNDWLKDLKIKLFGTEQFENVVTLSKYDKVGKKINN